MKARLFLSGLALLGLAMVGARLGDGPRDGAPSEWRLLKSDGVVAETFSYTFPPYSVTLLVLDPVPWMAWLPWAAPSTALRAGLGLILVLLAALVLLRHRKGMSW
jgi:hypothetical protein